MDLVFFPPDELKPAAQHENQQSEFHSAGAQTGCFSADNFLFGAFEDVNQTAALISMM